MNIACDARALVGDATGVGVWTTQVMAGLAATGGHRVLLAASRAFTPPPLLTLPGVEQVPPPRLAVPGTLWLHTTLRAALAERRPDLFVASLAVAPRRCPVPTVVMLHDLTPRTHPGRHTLANRFCFNAYLETSLDEAAVVVAGSEATADEALAHFPWLRTKLERIGYGVDQAFRPAAAGDDGAATRTRFAGGEPYLLHLGTLEPRKGLLNLIAAWEELVRRQPRTPALVLAGAPGWGGEPLARRLAASPFRHRIHLPGYVPAAAAVALLQHAAVFVLAAEVEGWGLPLAEAIACGTPAVASAIPSLRECGGDAALYAPPGDVSALSAAIAACLEAERAAALRARAMARAPLLSWPPVVSAWCDLVERVRSCRGRRRGGSATRS